MKISNAKLLKKEDTKNNLREENCLSKINLHARYYVFIFAISLAFMQII